MSYRDADLLDRHGYLESAAHRLDPRAKLLATLAFVLAVASFPKYALADLAPFIAFPVFMAIVGFVPLRTLLRRVILASPFVILVGAFNPLLDRAPAFELFGFTVTGGVLSFASITARGFLCVAAGVVLTATTSFPRLIQGLQSLRAPEVLTVQLMLLYRYLFLLVNEAGRMNRARRSRSAASRASLSTAAAMLSALLMRTLDRAEAIWLAMKSRGFEGRMLTPRAMNWRAADTAFLALVAGSAAALRMFPLASILSGWVR